MAKIDVEHVRYPFCIVWTPIPLLSWLFPFLGHTGIGMSDGVIRDFAGPYLEDDMAFGTPTKYYQMTPDKVEGGQLAWDRCVQRAADIYSQKMHNLFCDNCHSMVCLALNLMSYDGKRNWNMIKLAILLFFCGKFFYH
ncbi:hypothetical protein B4U79_01642 [Dinothrombium tinctorium]|uniref:Transmembrane protein 222-like protein n=1 Tax=Dinothrombium tinctorium TaxID=1965070 RepID=A0A3S3NUA8_9ACAR|nr:hypothetical protein B4U79_01642 [Dinothrombium tinctorium]